VRTCTHENVADWCVDHICGWVCAQIFIYEDGRYPCTHTSMCACVYIYSCVYKYMYMYTHTLTYIERKSGTHVSVNTRVQRHMHTVHIHAHTRTCRFPFSAGIGHYLQKEYDCTGCEIFAVSAGNIAGLCLALVRASLHMLISMYVYCVCVCVIPVCMYVCVCMYTYYCESGWQENSRFRQLVNPLYMTRCPTASTGSKRSLLLVKITGDGRYG
jgi:hypothetical protein